jgi:hypothetical protein
MKMEQQVCTLQQAKKLKEIGISQDSSFMWCVIMPDPTGEKYYYEPVYKHQDVDTLHETLAAAFTVAELGVMCRDCISGPTGNRTTYYATTDEYADYDLDTAFGDGSITGPCPNYAERPIQAQALADLLIWLIEKKLLSIEDVNQRLSA